MKLKYYAIKSGYRTGIFYDIWDNVKQYVNGYPNAEFKGFSNQKMQMTTWLLIKKQSLTMIL